MKRVAFNYNDLTEVQLTEFGAEQYNAINAIDRENLIEWGCQEKYLHPVFEYKAGDKVRLQFWEFCRKFEPIMDTSLPPAFTAGILIVESSLP